MEWIEDGGKGGRIVERRIVYREKEECVGKEDGERWGNRGGREEEEISTMHLKGPQVGKGICRRRSKTGWRECKE